MAAITGETPRLRTEALDRLRGAGGAMKLCQELVVDARERQLRAQAIDRQRSQSDCEPRHEGGRGHALGCCHPEQRVTIFSRDASERS
jgi:hypothetical protein